MGIVLSMPVHNIIGRVNETNEINRSIEVSA